MARASLRSLEPTWWPGAVANLFLVSSVGLLIYSDVGLSAQILTNAEEEVLGAASAVACEQPEPERRQLQATCSESCCDADDIAKWDGYTQDYWVNTVQGGECIKSCSTKMLVPGAPCGVDCGVAEGFTPPCAKCMGMLGYCIGVGCLSECMRVFTAGEEASPECQECAETKCYLPKGGFYQCTGFTTKLLPPPPPMSPSPYFPPAVPLGDPVAPPPPPSSPPPSTPPPSPPLATRSAALATDAEPDDASSYRSVGAAGDISYVYSVAKAWEGGAYLTALVIVFAAGAWPYLKAILLAAAYFAPLTPRGRAQLLGWCSRFARWALVDVTAVIALIAATDFRFVADTVHVKAEARVAITTFAVAGLLAIAVGEWMLHAHRRAEAAEGRREQDPSHLGCCGVPLRLADTLLATDAARAWPRLPLLLAPAALVLTAYGLAAPAMRFGVEETVTSDVPVRTERTWSFAQLGLSTMPVSDASPAVGTLLAIFYYVCCVAIPLATCALLAISAVLPPPIRKGFPGVLRRVLAAATALSAWSCLDMALLAAALVSSEYTGLVNELIAGMLSCPEGAGAKVAPFGEVLDGTWILLVGVVLGWAAQAVGAYQCAAFVELKEKAAKGGNEPTIKAGPAV